MTEPRVTSVCISYKPDSKQLIYDNRFLWKVGGAGGFGFF